MDTVLTGLDWAVIACVLLCSLAIGYFVKDAASTGGVEGFFVAGRNIRWYFLGTSIVATTFASDTPLAITGWIAQYGIAGNWFWWGGAIGSVAMTVFFARKWRNSAVVTDAEIAELRYGEKAATGLRAVKAFINCTLVNFIVLGWVFAGMVKISEPFMDWQSLIGPSIYHALEAGYPAFLIFHSLDNTLTIWVLVAVTFAYSALGGLRAVILTDLLQFVLAMGMSIVLSWIAVQHIGGLDAMWTQLAELYPKDDASTDGRFLDHEQLAAFVPSFSFDGGGSLGIPFSAFVLTLGFLWWTNANVDGSGYIAQRLNTGRDAGEAEKGALWYSVANFMLRSWPWVIAGVAALVLYPRAEVNDLADQFTDCLHTPATCSAEMKLCMDNRYACPIKGYSLLYLESVDSDARQDLDSQSDQVQVYLEDRERGYPALIRDLLPAGLLGLALASLMAAFMSTVSTHINWGASYVVNDFYYRFINPRASDRSLARVSRLSTGVIALLSIYVSTFIDNIGAMWELVAGMMAGLGLPHLLRWLWWRANAWTEISGMLTGLILALANFIVGRTSGFADGQMSIFPVSMASHPIHVICWVSLFSSIVAVTVTMLTKPVAEQQLRAFVEKVNPMGFWRGFNPDYSRERDFSSTVLYWLMGTASIYAVMFGIGFLLRLEYLLGVLLLVSGALLLLFMVRGMERLDHGRKG